MLRTFPAPSLSRRLAGAGALALALSLGACASDKGAKKQDLAASRVTTIGVNSYLWRASLDALSFMPLLQADSAGGPRHVRHDEARAQRFFHLGCEDSRGRVRRASGRIRNDDGDGLLSRKVRGLAQSSQREECKEA